MTDDGLKAFLAGLLGFIVLVAVGVGIWFLGWGVHRANVNKDYEINRQSSGYQQSLISSERDRATAYDVATEAGQKAVIKSQFCSVYVDLTYKPQDLVVAASHLGC